jgi:hypothetical protein
VILTFLLVGSILTILPVSFAANIVGGNYKNITVHTSVNISNSNPEVLAMIVYDTTNVSLNNLTLNAGATKSITCNASVRDWNGFNDIVKVNATLWHEATSTYNASNDNSSHYTNTSCILNYSTGTYTGVYTCTFDTMYYSNNGTWICNVTTTDNYNATGSLTNTTYIYPLYALNITDGIDYGNVPVEGMSNDIQANITNFGNMGINISVEGYAITRGDGLAMNCSIFGNIPVNYEKFALDNNTVYASKNTLTTTPGMIPGLTMPKQINSTLILNSTYWQLYIPPNPAGNCSGFIIFSAEAP